MHRTWGGIIAGALFVIPSIFILLTLSYIYAAYGNIPLVAGVLAGFKPIVVAIVVEAALKIGNRALKRRVHLVIAALAFIMIFFAQVPFPVIILAAALSGLLGTRLAPQLFSATEKTKQVNRKTEDKEGSAERLPLVIDDDAAPPAHTRPDRARSRKVLAVGLALWAVPFVALVFLRGWGSLHAQEYRFFTQAALVTFGGAYAVLAYVTQAAAGSYGWLTRAQAVDGLALAETTPGPLIMVLQFIGFMSAWNNPQGMTPVASGITGALITTYVTFLPCFIFIFLGAPYIERLRGNKSLTGALNGVTAAVVGVILNLAIVFGAAVIFPRGLTGGVEWFALFVSVAAFALLYKLKANVLWVVLTGGLAGLVRAILSG
jgi:chromate transporter